jgi:hypothetical protein
MTEDFKDSQEFSKEELEAEEAECRAEFEEDAEKHEDIMNRASSWAAGEGELLNQAGATDLQALFILILRHERILLEILQEMKKANGTV